MEFISLPSPPVPSYTQRVPLDGADYLIEIRWNQRDGWYIGLSDAAGDRIASPRKMVNQWDLLAGVVDERKPPGKLVLFDSTGELDDPGYEDLDQRHFLCYITLAEVDAGAIEEV